MIKTGNYFQRSTKTREEKENLKAVKTAEGHVYLLWKSVGLMFRCDHVEDALDSWQVDQEHGPHCRGYGNHQMAR